MTRKFSLPAGTTNRHKWHKEAAAALSAVTQTFNMMRQLHGTIGGDERESLVSVFSFGADEPKNPQAVEIYEAIGERFDWQITRENADAVRDAFREALPACRESIPTEDNRTTAEEDAAAAELRRTQEAERQAEAAEYEAEVAEHLATIAAEYPDAEQEGSKSEQARAAANLKRLLQARGLQCSVKSDSFSMGDSVTARVKTPDVPPEVREELDEIAERFSYSTFDPMTDSSGYKREPYGTAWRRHFGRTKYCRIEWEQSDENREACHEFAGPDGSGWQVWTGAHPAAAEFWAQWAEDHSAPAAPEPVQGGGFEIQKHHHTKRGFDYWLVVLADRVERDEFERLRDSCKAAGGWYSRKWGRSPGGFAFREQEQAGAWAVQEFGGDDTPPDPGKRRSEPQARPDAAKAAKFREMADKVRAEVEAKRAPHLENTPKRQREAMARRIDADHLERTEAALRALADLLDAGTLPAILRKFSTKKAIYAALRTRTESGGYYHIADTGEAADESPEAAALWQLIGPKDPAQDRADKLKNLRAQLPGKIAGYFPTPPDIAAEMVDRLGISHRRPWRLLEPSAGCGALLDAAAELANEPEVVCYEVNSNLREILQAKGYEPRSDFMQEAPGPRSGTREEFDAVLMNPPFERLQDIEHVSRAYEWLKPGGRLVAIMSPGPFFRKDRKAQMFRAWVEDLGGEVEDLPAGSFAESGTGVNACLLVLDKPDPASVYEEHGARAEEARRDLRAGFELTEQCALF